MIWKLICKNRIFLVLSFAVTLANQAGAADDFLPRLDRLQRNVIFAMRMTDGEEVPHAKLVSIDAETLRYDNGLVMVSVDRIKVFKAVQNNNYYSDYRILKKENSKYPLFITFSAERGDIIVDTLNNKYSGLILTETLTDFTIRTESGTQHIARNKVAAWRKNGIPHGNLESLSEKRETDSLSEVKPQKRFPIEVSAMLVGPWTLLPQASLGLGSDVSWPVFLGVRGSLGSVASKPFGLMKQASVFISINIINADTVHLYAGASYLWRSAALVDKIYSDQPQNPVQVSLVQTRYTLHFGLRFESFFIEIGAELPVSGEIRYSQPAPQSLTDATNIGLAAERIQSSMNTFETSSKLHLVLGFLF